MSPRCQAFFRDFGVSAASCFALLGGWPNWRR
uniref:Uncharacterized protein n=1 Tax=Caudovirales sp. ctlwr10 TaxID=2825771 RepID=A0A8S5Q480_9CAUD|nr:MAG TPA: hypothetical protein [Caudovirales sp. ctlwr10]